MKNIWAFKKENIKNYVLLAIWILANSFIDSNISDSDKKFKLHILMWGLVLIFVVYQSLKMIKHIKDNE